MVWLWRVIICFIKNRMFSGYFVHMSVEPGYDCGLWKGYSYDPQSQCDTSGATLRIILFLPFDLCSTMDKDSISN